MKRPAIDREYIAGLEKGLATIEAFSSGQERLSVTEAAQIVGLPRATARRCLLTLERLGYAEYDGKYYRLAPRALRLGNAYITSNMLARLVQPVIEASSERLGESMVVAVRDGASVIVIARTSVRRSLSAGLSVGMRLPIYCSAIGHVLLAAMTDTQAEACLKQCNRIKLTPKTRIEIPEIMTEVKRARSEGYAVNDQEVESDLRTIAVPIFDNGGKIRAGMSVSTSTTRTDTKTLVRKILPELYSGRSKLASLISSV